MKQWILICWLLSFVGTAALAFDDDRRINLPDFKPENFLDIKSYEFRKSQQDAWHETKSGWRAAGGSLDLDFLYFHSELKLEHAISNRASVHYHLKQKAFYASKPIRQQVELKIRVGDEYFISVLGFPGYEKRHANVGFAFTMGHEPWHFLRITRLFQDLYYNDKNFEEDRYRKEPIEDTIEGAFEEGPIRGRFRVMIHRPLEHFFPQDTLTFKHRGEEGLFFLDYYVDEDELYGIKYEGFGFLKSRSTTEESVDIENEKQTLRFLSLDAYWVDHQFRSEGSLTLGSRYDQILSNFNDFYESEEGRNYLFDTWQFYGIWLDPWKDQMSWEYGLYVGTVAEVTDYASQSRDDKSKRSLQAKFRWSWEWKTAQPESRFLFSTTWNVDSFFADPWDGGHISYQIAF